MMQYAILAMVFFGLVFAPYLGMVSAEQNISISKQRPQADQIKQKAYTLVQGKLQEDRVAMLMKQAHDKTVKDMKQNSLKFTNDDTYNLKAAYLKMAEMKRDNDEKQRKAITEKMALQAKMTQLKIEKMVKEGKLGKPQKNGKTIEYGRTN